MAHSDFLPPDLTEDQERILQAVLSSQTMGQAAEALDISRRNLYRMLDAPELVAALRRARGQMLEQAISKLQGEAAGAVETLGEILRDKQATAASRVRAAEKILEFALRGSEMLDVQAQLEELQAVYAELQTQRA
jgi:hypothetical protein